MSERDASGLVLLPGWDMQGDPEPTCRRCAMLAEMCACEEDEMADTNEPTAAGLTDEERARHIAIGLGLPPAIQRALAREFNFVRADERRRLHRDELVRALRELVSEEDRFERESGMKLADGVSDAVSHARAVLALVES